MIALAGSDQMIFAGLTHFPPVIHGKEVKVT